MTALEMKQYAEELIKSCGEDSVHAVIVYENAELERTINRSVPRAIREFRPPDELVAKIASEIEEREKHNLFHHNILIEHQVETHYGERSETYNGICTLL